MSVSAAVAGTCLPARWVWMPPTRKARHVGSMGLGKVLRKIAGLSPPCDPCVAACRKLWRAIRVPVPSGTGAAMFTGRLRCMQLHPRVPTLRASHGPNARIAAGQGRTAGRPCRLSGADSAVDRQGLDTLVLFVLDVGLSASGRPMVAPGATRRVRPARRSPRRHDVCTREDERS
eukprot:360740-Chlamydomonas_euryale.AAC.5